MKQYVTKEQWDEVAKEEKGIFENWMNETNNIGNYITIGVMIEFLREEEKNGRYNMEWIIRELLTPETLCDVLWITVKKQLCTL